MQIARPDIGFVMFFCDLKYQPKTSYDHGILIIASVYNDPIKCVMGII